jgi:hypothetical protein
MTRLDARPLHELGDVERFAADSHLLVVTGGFTFSAREYRSSAPSVEAKQMQRAVSDVGRDEARNGWRSLSLEGAGEGFCINKLSTLGQQR